MSQLHPVFNVVKLTPAPVDFIEGCCPHPPPLPEIIDGEEEWVVEEILDSKVMNRKLRYLVKCEGFGVEHNSWKPWDNIHAPERIMDFHRKHPGAACCIRATDFNSIPFCPSSSFTVLRCHSLEGGVDVRGHPVSHDNWPRIKTFQSAHPCSDDAIITIGHTLKPLDLRLFAMTMASSQVTIGRTSKPFNPRVPIFPLIIVLPLLVM